MPFGSSIHRGTDVTEREYPSQDYYPSARVRFIMRFEEYTDETSVDLPPTRSNIRKGGEPQTVPSGANSPQEDAASSDKLTQVIDGIVPARATLSRNGIRQADTMTMEFKYADLPIDPRTLRACAVQFVLGTVTAEDFHAGLQGALKPLSDGNTNQAAIPVNMVPEKFGDGRSNIRFEGWVDDWEVVWSESEPRLVVNCTDNTRQLIDQDAPPQLTLDPSLPIDEAVEGYLAEFPQFAGFQVQYLPEDGTPPVMDDVLTKGARRKGKSPPPGKGASGVQADGSVWDYLTDMTGMLGLTIRFEGTTIVIQQVRSLVKNPFPVRGDDPFTGRDLPGGGRLDRRTFVYGRNLEELRIRRNFTKLAARNIEVRCYVPEIKNVVIARHPPFNKRQTKANPGDTGDQTYLVIRVSGVRDSTVLRRIAQEAYEQMNRQELELSFVTKNLASYGGGNDDPDVLDMQPGDPIDIELQREQVELQGMTTMNLEDTLAIKQKAVDYLLLLGFNEEFAETYASVFINTSLVTTFRVRNMDIDWDEDDGVDISVDAINYAVVERSSADLPNGEETS